MKKGNKKRVFTREFKLDAVKLATSGNYTNAEVAEQLNVNENLIYKWKKSFEDEKMAMFYRLMRGKSSRSFVKKLEFLKWNKKY